MSYSGKDVAVKIVASGAIVLLGVLVVYMVGVWPLSQESDIVQRRAQTEVYRNRSCIVTRITISEKGNRDQFYVIEGGTEHGRLQNPKCLIEVIR